MLKPAEKVGLSRQAIKVVTKISPSVPVLYFVLSVEYFSKQQIIIIIFFVFMFVNTH